MKLYYKYIRHTVNLMMYAPNRRIENMPLDGSNAIQLYKGSDSKIEIIVKDNDRKPVSLIGKTLIAYVVNTENGENILTRTLDDIDETKGHYELTIFSNELNAWQNGYYNIIVTTIDHLGLEQHLYNEYGYNVANIIRVNDRTMNKYKPTIEMKPSEWLIGSNQFYYSSAIKGKGQQHNLYDVSTFVFYLDDFTGEIEIQGCLDNTIPINENDWVEKIYFEEFENYTDINYINIIGNYQWLRIRYKNENGTFDKVCIRI